MVASKTLSVGNDALAVDEEEDNVGERGSDER